MNKKKPKIKKPPILFKKTQNIIKNIENIIDMPVLTYWNSNGGSICDQDVNVLYETLLSIGKQERVSIFIKSSGGNGKASLRIVNLLREYFNNITALVPLGCASASTMIGIGADKILMGPLAYLTAVDTSIKHSLAPRNNLNNAVPISFDGISRIIKLWNKEKHSEANNPYQEIYKHIHPLIIGEIDRSESLSIKLCNEIMSYYMTDAQKTEEISHTLNSFYPSHSYPITLKEAKKINLNAEKMDDELNSQLLGLNSVYSEMGQTAHTDYDKNNYHSHSILNISECLG